MSDINSIGSIHRDIMKRCYDTKSILYKTFGAKSITVCDEWHDRQKFREWSMANGYNKGLRLLRHDTSKGYSPENCEWGEGSKKRCTSKSARVKKLKEHRVKMKDIAGITDNYGKSRIYHIYHGMIQRCFNENDHHYANYGNRGISVCDEWLGKDGFFYFYKWAMNNGYNDSLSIDRIDNNAGYSPNNCRWTIQKVQANNRRNSKRYPFNGKEMTVREIGEINNVNPERLRYRLNKGMSVGDAILDLSQKGSHPL